MAPIAVSPHENEGIQFRIKQNISQYKEQSAGPLTYDKRVEEEGTADAPKARVSSFSESTVSC